MLSLFCFFPVSNAKYVGAYDVEITKEYVKSTAKCSCSLSTDYDYHTRYFKNYCPNCHKYGTINYEQGSGNHNPEGMWYCTNCDVDFCLVHGKSHDHRGLFLTKIENIDRIKKTIADKNSTFSVVDNNSEIIKFKKKLNWQNIGSREHFKIKSENLYRIQSIANKYNNTNIF